MPTLRARRMLDRMRSARWRLKLRLKMEPLAGDVGRMQGGGQTGRLGLRSN